MCSGQVKWFDVKKGFGFIVGPEGQDVFVHYSSIAADGFRTLKDGEAVEYELVQGEKGFHAQDVRRAGAANEKHVLVGRDAGEPEATETYASA